MTTPSMTTMPIPSAHVMPGSWTIVAATMVFNPRPAASARGKSATPPMRMDMTPATSAVPAAMAALFGPLPPPR